MTRFETLYILVACAIVYFTYRCEAFAFPCEICKGENCEREPEDCFYGTTVDLCRRKICKKGPGNRCGGPYDIMGTCGEGLQCRCERCTGCSLDTMECYKSEMLCLG